MKKKNPIVEENPRPTSNPQELSSEIFPWNERGKAS